MNDPKNQSSPEPQSHHRHESTDVNPLPIGLFAAGLMVMLGLVLPFLGWVFWGFEAAARRADPQQSPLAEKQIPRPPRLQVEPSVDLVRFRQNEHERLSSYGWIDRDQKIVHIPISKAMKLLADRGIPEPQGPVVETAPEKPAPKEPAPTQERVQ